MLIGPVRGTETQLRPGEFLSGPFPPANFSAKHIHMQISSGTGPCLLQSWPLQPPELVSLASRAGLSSLQSWSLQPPELGSPASRAGLSSPSSLPSPGPPLSYLQSSLWKYVPEDLAPHRLCVCTLSVCVYSAVRRY